MGPSGNVVKKVSLPVTTNGMSILIERMAGNRFKVLGDAFNYSLDVHNYLVGKSVDNQLANPEGLHHITKYYKKTDENDCEAIAWYLRLPSRGEIDLLLPYIVRDEEMRLCDSLSILGFNLVTFLAPRMHMTMELWSAERGMASRYTPSDLIFIYSSMVSVTTVSKMMSQQVPENVRKVEEDIGLNLFSSLVDTYS